jgi:hypothetical protein
MSVGAFVVRHVPVMAGAFKDLKVLGIFHEEDRFARDSPLEQRGFELPVPRVVQAKSGRDV